MLILNILIIFSFIDLKIDILINIKIFIVIK